MNTVFLKLRKIVSAGYNLILDLCYVVASLWKFACKRFPKLKRMTVTAASVILTVCLLCTIFSTAGLTYALEVTVNGTNYGYVKSEEVADSALTMITDDVAKNTAVTVEPDTSYRYAITSTSSLISSGELRDEIINGEDDYVSDCVIYVNGVLAARADSVEEANSFLRDARGDSIFYNDIVVEECVLDKTEHHSLPYITALSYLVYPTYVPYTVHNGDTAESIANDFGVSIALIEGLNLSADYSEGSVVNVVVSIPALTLSEEKEYERSRVALASNGASKATRIVETVLSYRVNGVEYSSEVVKTREEEMYSDKPVAKSVVKVGKKGFVWPMDKSYHQYVSSYWGDGRGHEAVDIASKVGVPVLSVKDGYVESINSSGSGYGQHFVINHGNGLKTLYAHCSKLYVNVGDKVSQGEVVGLVGNTGRSTGPHLHFEVFVNGGRVNPCSYLGI